MPAPKLTAKEKADRGPIPALYGRSVTMSTPGRSDDRLHPAWTVDGWRTHYSCAIAGSCITGEHVLPEPVTEPDPASAEA